MTDGIAHLAGPQITFDGVQVQRCVWCGALVEERDLNNMGVATDSSASTEVQQEEANNAASGHWEGWVLIAGTFPVMLTSIDEPGDGKPPREACMYKLPKDLERV